MSGANGYADPYNRDNASRRSSRNIDATSFARPTSYASRATSGRDSAFYRSDSRRATAGSFGSFDYNRYTNDRLYSDRTPRPY